MILRAVSMLGLVVFVAWAAFQYLVRNEVDRVMSVHVLDKSAHLIHALESNERRMASLRIGQVNAATVSDFAAMADAIHVASVTFFDPEGREFGRLLLGEKKRVRTPDGSDIVHAEGTSHRWDAGKPAEPHGQGHGHDHGGKREVEVRSYLVALPAESREDLRPLLENAVDRLVIRDTLSTEDGHDVHYASAILPIVSGEGERIGYVSFLMDISHIYDTYADGVVMFGMLFMISGGVLFGIPAFAFWYQKRVAERSSRDAQFLSRHDVLTGLLNRTVFSEQAETLLQEGELGFAAFVDVDRFKLINDTHGHAIGDAFLRRVADLFHVVLGPEVPAARLGGDEFAVLLPKMPEEQALAHLNELVAKAATDHSFDGVTLSTTLSVGVAEPRGADSLEDVLQRADTALYFAKSGGRNRVCHYEEAMGTAARRRRFLEVQLREASSENSFTLAYQPLVDARSGSAIGYEALLRLNEPDGTPIPPSEFVPIAEEIGLIDEIGTWVLNAATRDIAALDDVSSVSVNLSAEQFRSGRLIEAVRAALEGSGLAPERLELEVTETLVLSEDTGASFQIDALKELGVRIAMDDFGTGFSSLATLWKYGFDRIKIDKSFIASLEVTPEKSRELIDSIILLGGRMGMKVTAEGIETDVQRAVLTGLGCDVLQGYFFGRPAALEDIRAKLASGKAS